jgi:hypothetical protein
MQKNDPRHRAGIKASMIWLPEENAFLYYNYKNKHAEEKRFY